MAMNPSFLQSAKSYDALLTSDGSRDEFFKIYVAHKVLLLNHSRVMKVFHVEFDGSKV